MTNPGQQDLDGDGQGDVCDAQDNRDVDADGVQNHADNCPAIANGSQADLDADGSGDACDAVDDRDGDGDGARNFSDNCPQAANADQADTDRDGVGDACDSVNNDDFDGDRVFNPSDNCPNQANPAQEDLDGDGVGDACDPQDNRDGDGDGVQNHADNCPVTMNFGQGDLDGDGAGDACDAQDNRDGDGDGVQNHTDNCPVVINSDQADTDGDGVGNDCDAADDRDADGDGVRNEADNCLIVGNPDQADADRDGTGDACETTGGIPGKDSDGDGLEDARDNCPVIPNRDQADSDQNGVGDACTRAAADVCPGGAAPPVADASLTPYLQTPTADSIWVSYMTSGPRDVVNGKPTLIRWGSTPEALSNSKNGSAEWLSDTTASHYYHTVQLTGLAPSTCYYYQVESGAERSPILRFRTQPPLGEKRGVFRFMIMGDNQIIAQQRFIRMLRKARGKVESLYGSPLEEVVNLAVNLGDQVDVGTMDHYRNLHFYQSSALSGSIPFMTSVGNHELYEDSALTKYKQHFFLENISYQEISTPATATERYYANQVGSVLFVHLDTEAPNDIQTNWLRQVVDAAKNDASVEFIFSFGHRPPRAEQYVTDVSPTMRDVWIPMLSETPKHVLNATGHHHLYARGQRRDEPLYQMISGATAWDQYWGQSSEQDFDDVQKTIANWAWQLVELDLDRRTMRVESYSEAHPLLYKDADPSTMNYNSRLIDVFYRELDLDSQPPARPTITTAVPASVSLTQPFEFESSTYHSPADVPMGATQFQIASDSDFLNRKIDRIRDFENLYNDTGAPDYLPVDQHAGVDILRWTLKAGDVPNGSYFLRARHRDRNVIWSPWSEPIAFEVTDSTVSTPRLKTEKYRYGADEPIVVSYEGAPGNQKDWVGAYRSTEVPGATGTTSDDWNYINGNRSGTITLKKLTDLSQSPDGQEYFIGLFTNDGYQEVAPRIKVYVGDAVQLALDRTAQADLAKTIGAQYASGESVGLSWSKGPADQADSLAIFRAGDTPGSATSVQSVSVSTASGSRSISGLPDGYYFAQYLIHGSSPLATAQPFFVGERIATTSADDSIIAPGESFTIRFSGGPGHVKDYIGFFRSDAEVLGSGEAALCGYFYFNGVTNGAIMAKSSDLTRANTTLSPSCPYLTDSQSPRDYFAVLLHNDSYTESSERVYVTVQNNANIARFTVSTQLAEVSEGLSHTLSWNGSGFRPTDKLVVYRDGDTPRLNAPVFSRALDANTGSVQATLPPGSHFATIQYDGRFTEISNRLALRTCSGLCGPRPDLPGAPGTSAAMPAALPLRPDSSHPSLRRLPGQK